MFIDPLYWINPNQDKQFLSYLSEMWSGRPWPICGTLILKDAGCNHMTWSKCSGEFCWLWLRVMNGPIHPRDIDNFWPSNRLWKLLFILYFVFFSVVIHVYYRFGAFQPLLGVIFHWIAVILLAIVFWFTGFSWISKTNFIEISLIRYLKY